MSASPTPSIGSTDPQWGSPPSIPGPAQNASRLIVSPNLPAAERARLQRIADLLNGNLSSWLASIDQPSSCVSLSPARVVSPAPSSFPSPVFSADDSKECDSSNEQLAQPVQGSIFSDRPYPSIPLPSRYLTFCQRQQLLLQQASLDQHAQERAVARDARESESSSEFQEPGASHGKRKRAKSALTHSASVD